LGGATVELAPDSADTLSGTFRPTPAFESVAEIMQAFFELLPAYLSAANAKMPTPHELQGLSSEQSDLALRNATLGVPQALLIVQAVQRVDELGLEVRGESGEEIETQRVQVGRFPVEAFIPAEARAALSAMRVEVPRTITITLGNRRDVPA
jgi:hypothetical protein